MKKINNIKRMVGIIILVLIVIIGIYAVLIVLPNNDKTLAPEEVERIKYDYVLYQRDDAIYKETFDLLKTELSKETVDYKKYAEYISKLFIIDLYTLNNKLSKDDVGGIQYVKDDVRDNFVLNASSTMYKYINVKGVDLPEVSTIELVEINDYKYSISNKEYEGYEVKLKWNYKEDLGYDKEGTIYIIKDKEELFVVEKK